MCSCWAFEPARLCIKNLSFSSETEHCFFYWWATKQEKKSTYPPNHLTPATQSPLYLTTLSWTHGRNLPCTIPLTTCKHLSDAIALLCYVFVFIFHTVFAIYILIIAKLAFIHQSQMSPFRPFVYSAQYPSFISVLLPRHTLRAC